MKAILVCPAERETVAALAENIPLVALPVLGKPLVEYWIEHLAALGATEILILAADRPEKVRVLVGDGARWGVGVSVLPEARELTPDEARKKYRGSEDAG
ncbi:MAG TPA: sugar phosphate nucleotidyltransferase, partial [Candidatus Binatia bacterium]|nr:sugar phosphate nucleotidyltransferase [Candidatus Binatia bacterium]